MSKVKVICRNIDCDYGLEERVFEVPDICPIHKVKYEDGSCEHCAWDKAMGNRCPKCGGNELAPVWLRSIEIPGLKEIREELRQKKRELAKMENKTAQLKAKLKNKLPK